MTKVAIYTDKPILAEGFRTVVAIMQGFMLSAIYPDDTFMADHIRRTACPDLLVVDVTSLVTMGTLKQLKAIAPSAAIILWIEGPAPEYAHHALRLGVRALLPRNASLAANFECLREVANGGTWVKNDNDIDNKLRRFLPDNPVLGREARA